MSALTLITRLLLLGAPSLANELVAPGALTRGGGGGGRRHGGWGVVDKWPHGFFVAGSSIARLNGVYVRVDRDHGLPHWCHMTWRNVDTGWVISNVEISGYVGVGDHASEWLFIDVEGRDRFVCRTGGSKSGANPVCDSARLLPGGPGRPIALAGGKQPRHPDDQACGARRRPSS